MKKLSKGFLAMEEDFSNAKMGLGHRHMQAIMMFSCIVTCFSMRSSIGVALVAMSPLRLQVQNATFLHNKTNSHLNSYIRNGTSHHNSTSGFENKNAFEIDEIVSDIPTFAWDKHTQDTIQSSFFWGYMVLQLPAGALAHRFGAKILLVFSMVINSLISFCIPWAAISGGATWVYVCRVVQGLAQAFLIPSLHTLLGKWAPIQERGRITALVHGGQAIGTVVGLPIAGFLAASSYGWPAIFHFNGLLAAIVGGVWAWFGAESPSRLGNISDKEKLYIQLGLGQSVNTKEVHRPVPWKNILSHRGLWANVTAHIGASWGLITIFSQIPAYMSNVMKVDIKSNGMLTALPFLVMWLTNFVFSWTTDFIINKKIMSVTGARKLANTVGSWPTALGLVVLGYISPDNLVAMETVLVLLCAFMIASHMGFQVNHIDISPNFSGTMMSVSNFIANGIASFSPMLAAYFLSDSVTDQHMWRYVFFTSAAIHFLTSVVYILMGTAVVAEWNDPSDIPETEKCNPESEHCKITNGNSA